MERAAPLDAGGELADVALDGAGGRLAEVEERVREPLLVLCGRELCLERDDRREREALQGTFSFCAPA